MPTDMRSAVDNAPAKTSAPVPARPRSVDAGVQYVVGVDGGGTSTRARVCTVQGQVLGEGTAGPSGLLQGSEQAWRNITQAIGRALEQAPNADARPALTLHNTALGLGLAGANDAALRQQLLEANPGYRLRLENDAFTALLGAHAGGAGAIVILGTGSVGQALHADGHRVVAGGWGFPSGDEGSGAALGLKAINLAQRVVDGRLSKGPLAEAVLAYTGNSRDALLAWSCQAGQSEFARLAPLVFDCEDRDVHAAALVGESLRCIEELVATLDPQKLLPLALLGSIGKRLAARARPDIRLRLCEPAGDAMDGALALCYQ